MFVYIIIDIMFMLFVSAQTIYKNWLCITSLQSSVIITSSIKCVVHYIECIIKLSFIPIQYNM